MFAVQARGCEVQTIEGLADTAGAQTLLTAFRDCHATQCGFCTSGFVVCALDLLGRNSKPTDAEIREGIAGNICRCTGYVHIVEAIQRAAGFLPELHELEDTRPK